MNESTAIDPIVLACVGAAFASALGWVLSRTFGARARRKRVSEIIDKEALRVEKWQFHGEEMRVRVYYLNAHILLWLINGKWNKVKVTGPRSDAKLVRVWETHEAPGWCMAFEHESYKSVDPGDRAPTFEFTVEAMR